MTALLVPAGSLPFRAGMGARGTLGENRPQTALSRRVYTIIEDLHGAGSFVTEMQLFIGDAPIPRNHSVSASDDVKIEVGLSKRKSDLKVVLTECWATPSSDAGDPVTFRFINNRWGLGGLCPTRGRLRGPGPPDAPWHGAGFWVTPTGEPSLWGMDSRPAVPGGDAPGAGSCPIRRQTHPGPGQEGGLQLTRRLCSPPAAPSPTRTHA